jgi:tetratricopeptide (TPR) repeat protein
LSRDFDLIEIARSQAARARSSRGAGKRAGGASADEAAPTLAPAEAVPNYRLIRQIYRGGQGVVYDAIQVGTQRRVAVKFMREGPFAGDSDFLRFEREIRILASLRHPNIVAIHECGSSGGFFYYVMEYVDGRPIDEHFKESVPEARDILACFALLCEAVHAAHLRGIIHRDLKPRNILVDAEQQPHVLDFGLAKSTQPDAAERSMTESGQFVGSLLWASPEQAEGRRDDIDLRSDVYSLGVILFQILTGRFPYDVSGGMRQILENIENREPDRPSAVRQGLEDDVDTIVLKCLQKDPSRRYQTAGDLAGDVRRYLGGDPIDAKRDHTLYILRKAIRRHRLPVAAALGVFLLAVASAITFSMMYRTQKALREESERQTAIARQERRRAEAATDDARQKFRMVSDTASFMLEQVSTKLADILGAGPLKSEILEKTYERFEALAREQSDDPVLRLKQAQTRRYLGIIAVDLGKRDEAQGHALAGQQQFQSLLAEQPERVEYLHGYSGCCSLLGSIALYRHDLASAEAHCRRSLDAAERAVRLRLDDPDSVGRYSNVCGILSSIARLKGQSAESAEWLGKSTKLKKQLADRFPENLKYKREYALCEYFHARAEHEAGRTDKAVQGFERAVATGESVLKQEPTHAGSFENLSICYEQLATITREAGRLDESLGWARRKHDIDRKRLDAEPSNLTYQIALARACDRVAMVAMELNRSEEAEAARREALGLHRDIVRDDPKNDDGRMRLVYCLGELGKLCSAAGRNQEAVQYFNEAIEKGEPAISAGLPLPLTAFYIAAAHRRLGDISFASGEPNQARTCYSRAVQVAQAAYERTPVPRESKWARLVFEYAVLLARAARASGDEHAAEIAEQEAARWREKLSSITLSDDKLPPASQPDN